jgi:uncharacterized membrane protein YdjX (TVP38/TMEM64 family)
MIQLSKPSTQFWLLVVILLVTVFIGYMFDFDKSLWADYFNRIPFLVAGALFIAAYVGITSVIWLSKDLLRIVGAVVFGAYWSTLFIWIGELVNAAIFFHISRRMGRAYVEEKFHIRKGRLDRAGRSMGVWHIFILRNILPFKIADLAYGLTSCSFRKYLIVSAIALPARIFIVQLLCAALGMSALNPAKVEIFILENWHLFVFSFFYLIIAFLVVMLFRKEL